MSGRVKRKLPDGRVITGFRKSFHPLLGRNTPITRQRKPQHAAGTLPLLRLSCQLPTALAFALAPGPYPGIIGLSIVAGGRAVVEGRNREWLFGQLEALLKKHARDLPGRFFPAEISDGNRTENIQIILATGKPAMIVVGTAMRPMILEG